MSTATVKENTSNVSSGLVIPDSLLAKEATDILHGIVGFPGAVHVRCQSTR